MPKKERRSRANGPAQQMETSINRAKNTGPVADGQEDKCGCCGRWFRTSDAVLYGLDEHGHELQVGSCCRSRLVVEADAIGIYVETPSEADYAALARRAGLRGGGPGAFGPWCIDDRKWFAAHPARCHRARPPFPGELAASGWDATATLIVVRQVAPGQRVRLPLIWGGPPLPDHEDFIAAFADALVSAVNEGKRHIDGAQLKRRVMATLAMPKGRA
jgi:hypothetical protein